MRGIKARGNWVMPDGKTPTQIMSLLLPIAKLKPRNAPRKKSQRKNRLFKDQAPFRRRSLSSTNRANAIGQGRIPSKARFFCFNILSHKIETILKDRYPVLLRIKVGPSHRAAESDQVNESLRHWCICVIIPMPAALNTETGRLERSFWSFAPHN